MTLRWLGPVGVLVLATAGPAKAGPPVAIGLAADLASARVVGEAPKGGSYSGRLGAGVGAALELGVASGVWLSLQPGWVQGGANVEFLEAPEENGSLRVSYLELPLVVRVYTESTGSTRPYVVGGLAVGFPLEAELESAGTTEDVLGELSDADARAKFGVGLGFPVGGQTMLAELLYTQGLTNLTRNDERPERARGSPRYKASSIGLRVTWMWR